MDNSQPSLFADEIHFTLNQGTPAKEEVAADASSTQVSLNALYTSFIETKRAMEALLIKHQDLEKQLLPNLSRCYVIDTSIDLYARNAVKSLVSDAIENYSVNGDRLMINTLQEVKELGLQAQFYEEIHERRAPRDNPIVFDEAQPIDLDMVANHLERKYGGEAGLHVTYKQQAKVLDHLFRFEKQEMKTTGRGVVLRLGNFIETCKFSAKKYSIESSKRNAWERFTKAMKIIADYMEMPQLKSDLDELCMSVYPMQSFETAPTWQTKYFHLRTFAAGHAHFTVHPEVASKLQQFLGLYLEP